MKFCFFLVYKLLWPNSIQNLICIYFILKNKRANQIIFHILWKLIWLALLVFNWTKIDFTTTKKVSYDLKNTVLQFLEKKLLVLLNWFPTSWTFGSSLLHNLRTTLFTKWWMHAWIKHKKSISWRQTYDALSFAT